ncbi:hypothetical protein [Ciceribacter thiooxidans]|uniref:Uncharacterized protein n=1 Tax=Ciceribacter thiooxidans TaxID=1969821 RepID=A0ABV7I0E1_9HYPH|nr:hypothetical protein [Ciceribacter thiooxidans]
MKFDCPAVMRQRSRFAMPPSTRPSSAKLTANPTINQTKPLVFNVD